MMGMCSVLWVYPAGERGLHSEAYLCLMIEGVCVFQMTGCLIGRSVPGGVLVFFLRHSVL